MHADLEERLSWSPDSYIEATHVKFLESAGARVTPVSMDQSRSDLKALMSKLNGLYIPGDHSSLLTNQMYATFIDNVV